MSFNINDIRANLSLGGARPALFDVTITNPVNTGGDSKLPFLAKATSLPESTLGVIEVPYFGRNIKVAGTRKFSEWSVTVINDEDYVIRNALEEWTNAINSLEGNLDTLGTSAPLAYKSQAIVTHYSKIGQVLRVYQFNGIWPSAVGAMELGWERGDEIMEFQVTFQYDSFRVLAGPTGDMGGV